MARAWSAWLPDLLPQLPNCPTVLVEHELKRAAQEFFSRTRAFKTMLAPIAVLASQENVTVVPDDPEQYLVGIEHAWLDGKEINATTAELLAENYGSDWKDHTGSPTSFMQETSGVLRLYPIPTDAAVTGLVCRVSVTPSEVSTGIPDDLGVTYRKELTCGAKAKLMLYANKPWTSLDHGQKHERDFEDGIAAATWQVATAYGNSRVESRKAWC